MLNPMSGHSKWHQIKHKKEIVDQKRGQLFSKILRAVTIAARDNPDPKSNPRLRAVILKARANNVPNDNIERAINKSGENKNIETVLIEAYGPEKTALIIEGITDSKNRTIAEIKKILQNHELKIADPGSVLWSFTKISGEWQAKFWQSVSAETKIAVESLVAELEARDDVQKITTNIK